MNICNYGCSQTGKHQLKNGKWCCSKSLNQCPSMRQKNSESCQHRYDNWTDVEREVHSNSLKGKTGWSKGLTKDVDLRLEKSSKSAKRYWSSLTKEQIEQFGAKISKKLKGNPKAGGYRKNTGRGKKGWYKGFRSDSSWELAYIIYNLEHCIMFKRNVDRFEYLKNSVKCHYTPDFILEDGTYIEIKGYYTELDRIKHSQFEGSLLVLQKKEMSPILDYVVSKYGRDFITLYDGSKCVSNTKLKSSQRLNLKPKHTLVKKSTKICTVCSTLVSFRSKTLLCKKCSSELNRKVKNRPSKEELEILIKEKPITHIGKHYCVSDNAVNKWLKYYGIKKMKTQ